MINILPLTDENTEQFKELFAAYYTELDCGENIPHLLDEYVLPDFKAGLIDILIAENCSADCSAVGFIIFQIDDIDNDWNFKEGWGNIREIYIFPSSRRHGAGKNLLKAAEYRLKEKGINKAYCLPYEGALPFFTACGYAETGEYSEDLDCPVYEKTI